jgi:hypothetical protein
MYRLFCIGAVEELGVGYDVTLQGRFDKTPIRLEIVVASIFFWQVNPQF